MKKVKIISKDEIVNITTFGNDGFVFSNGDEMSYSALIVAGKEFEKYTIDTDSYLYVELNNITYKIPPCAWEYFIEPGTSVLAWNKESYRANCKIYVGETETGKHKVIDSCTKESIATSIFDYVLAYSEKNLEIIKTRLKGE